jgi:hypothetical protein
MEYLILFSMGSFCMFYGWHCYKAGVVLEDENPNWNEYQVKTNVDPYYGKAGLFMVCGGVITISTLLVGLWRALL